MSGNPADTVIRNGLIATQERVFPRDIAISDGVIMAVTAPGAGPEAREEIDARGRVVMPGCIDVHAAFPQPRHVPQGRLGDRLGGGRRGRRHHCLRHAQYRSGHGHAG